MMGQGVDGRLSAGASPRLLGFWDATVPDDYGAPSRRDDDPSGICSEIRMPSSPGSTVAALEAATPRLNRRATKKNMIVIATIVAVSIPKYVYGSMSAYMGVTTMSPTLPPATVSSQSEATKLFRDFGAAVKASSRPTTEMQTSAAVTMMYATTIHRGESFASGSRWTR